MNHIPSLADLALQYGTITKKQFEQLNSLFNKRINSNNPCSFEELMQGQKLATAYQVGLLKLIREYLIVKKQGETFGKIAIEKGYASPEDVSAALEIQKKEFKSAKIKKLIGDILVEKGVITVKQRNEVLHDQQMAEMAAENLFSTPETEPVSKKQSPDQKISLTPYEKQFLRIQALDTEFAAAIIEKKMASERKVKIAQKIQEESFEKDHELRILGDIMVELDFLTVQQKNLILQEQNRLNSLDIQKPIENFEIEISRDRLEGWVRILDSKAQITVSDIKNALKLKKITQGIFSDAILNCNLEVGNTRFLCAAQDYGVQLVKQKKTSYFFDIRSRFLEDVKKGTALAEYSSANVKIPGKNIHGEDTDILADSSFRCGIGVRESRDKTKAFAGKTGCPVLSVEGKLYIHPSVSVLEDADLRYGPLEPYANLTISGILTGAYPVTAGSIKAEEIRGAVITAIGDIESRVGITDSTIISQGNIKARYLHNCRVETFGDVCIENEIIDSKVYSGGKINCEACHLIASTVYGKNGVILSGAGSDKTPACIIGAGTEHQVIQRIRRIDSEVGIIRQDLDTLIESRNEQIGFSKKTFQKMIELKIFHDRAKKKKEKLTSEFKQKKESLSKNELKNIVKLINNFENRKISSRASLKKLNAIKKKYDKETDRFEKKIEKLKPRIKRKTLELKNDVIAFIEHARRQKKSTSVSFKNQVFAGTVLKGNFSSLTLSENNKNFKISEKQFSENHFEMVIQKN